MHILCEGQRVRDANLADKKMERIYFLSGVNNEMTAYIFNFLLFSLMGCEMLFSNRYKNFQI